MTVVEIKEYIQNSKIKIDSMIPPNAKKKADEVLREVLSMLDELEERPKAKWIKTPLSYYDEDYGYECSNCKEIYCTEYDFEEMAYNYCPNCGARIDNELEE